MLDFFPNTYLPTLTSYLAQGPVFGKVVEIMEFEKHFIILKGQNKDCVAA